MNLFARLWRRLAASGTSSIPAATEKPGAPPVSPDPVFVAPQDDASIGRFIVVREAVLNPAMQVVGYSFSQADEDLPALFALERDKALLQYVCGKLAQKMVGDRIAFVSMGDELLAEPMVDFLALTRTIPLLRTTALQQDDERLIERISALKQAGITVGLDDGMRLLQDPALANVVGTAFFSVVETLPPDLLQISRQLATQYPSLKLGVLGLETQEEFDACCRLGFAYLQGPFIRRREQWSQNPISTSTLRICNLLSSMRRGADLNEIAEEARQDPMISFRILRLANSAATGATQQVNSVREAVLINGRDIIYRWFVMLLFSTAAESPANHALMEASLARGKLMELLAGRNSTPAMRDELFLTGMLSLLDVMLKVPMEQLLLQLTLPAEVTNALLQRTGSYADLLQLAEANDQGDQFRLKEMCAALGIELGTFNQAITDAGGWARLATLAA